MTDSSRLDSHSLLKTQQSKESSSAFKLKFTWLQKAFGLATLFGILSAVGGVSRLARAEDIVVPRADIEALLAKTGRLETMKAWNVTFSFWELKDGQRVRLDYGSRYEDTNKNSKIDGSDEGFFNPASTVKTAIATLVLEELKKNAIKLSDSYRAAGMEWTTFESDLQMMQVLSDNEATNRLLLFLGFDLLHSRMNQLGFHEYTVERLMLGKGTLIESPPYEVKTDGKLIQRPRRPVTVTSRCEEAPGKSGNCASQADLLNILLLLAHPTAKNGFDIRESDRFWLLNIMSKTPKSLGYDYPDDWNRFLQSRQEDLVGQHGRLISKGGVALWSKTWTDTSLILSDDGRRIAVSITVFPPEDVTQKVAFPFMADLALALKTFAKNY